jgi:hypothetical protein
MDRVTRYEWHGNPITLTLLFVLVITIPLAVVYLLTNLLRIETQMADGEEFSQFLRKRRGS